MLSNISTFSFIIGLLAAVANSHFVLTYPTSLGYNDASEAVSPCDTFNPTDRSKGVQDWPIAGAGFVVITTHTSVTWDIKAALVSDTSTWVPLTLVLSQTGVGFFC